MEADKYRYSFRVGRKNSSGGRTRDHRRVVRQPPGGTPRATKPIHGAPNASRQDTSQT